MASSSDTGRSVRGVVALDPAMDAGRCEAVFSEQFTGNAKTVARSLAISSSWGVAGQTAAIWSQGAIVVWDTRQGDYLRLCSGDELDAIAPAIRSGAAWPALDDCTVFQDREGVLLFASGAGATTFYLHQRDGCLIFANRPQLIRVARQARLDRLGVGEVVRFGANYGHRTILEGVNRIPIGHLIECNPAKPPRPRPYIDFSHCPIPERDEEETREEIGAAIDRNLALIDGPRDLLFSGGVDSALLALHGKKHDLIDTGWFYSVGQNDPERQMAREAAARIGIRLEIVQDTTSPADIVERIGAYALPTLDFSIIPTFALGSAVVAARGHTTLVDGTGGDAWFGFGSLAHAGSWRTLNRLHALSPLARAVYRTALPFENLKFLRPIKGLARAPVLPSAALGHMCANPVYSSLLDLAPEEWLAIEEDTLSLMRSLTGGRLGSAIGETIVSDACLIAVAQFAAKTSQWSHAEHAATFYPFLMPNMVSIGRTMPPHHLIRNGEAKPLLKDMVAASALGRDFAYRRKSGFQPPLQSLLQDERTREILMIAREREEGPWTAAARDMPSRLLRDRNSLRIGGLYAIWSRLVIEFWLNSLRQ